MTVETKPQEVLLYRVENPNIVPMPNGVTSRSDLAGQSFSFSLDTALVNLCRSTQTFGPGAAPVDGARLVIAHVPEGRLDSLHVFNQLTATDMGAEIDNYIVPRDGSVPFDTVPLDNVVGDLRGRLGNYVCFREARERIQIAIGEMVLCD